MSEPFLNNLSSHGSSASAALPTLPLSVLIRTMNEADRLARTLRSVQALGAEVVVIDAGSSDATVAIARSFGATVYVNPWPGFGPQRRFGESKCSHDFVFSLDADEVLTPQITAEIRARFATGAPPRLMIIRKAPVYPHHDRPWPLSFCHEQVLIYDRRIAVTGPNPNWDKLEIQSSDVPVRLKNPLWHFSLRSLNHAVAKAVFVGQLAADTQTSRSTVILGLRVIVEFPLAFVKYYVFRRYALGGLDGFVFAMVGAFSRFIRIALMFEQARRRQAKGE